MAAEAPSSATRIDVARALREGALAGLIAFGLLLPLIGFNTVQNIHNELVLETRWPLLAVLVAVVAGIRFLHELLIAPWLARRAARPKQAEFAPGRSRWARWLVPFTLGFAIVYPPLALALVASRVR